MSKIYEFNSITKYYAKNKVGVENINLSIPQNETTIFVGQNGAGKTTTIKLILGLIRPTKGTITYLNEEYYFKSGNKKIGFLPELMYFPEQLTVKEFLLNIALMRGMGKKNALEIADYYVEKMNLSDSYNVVMRKLSKGMRQKVGIIQSFIHDPEVLIFDEPTSGLDPESRILLFDLIKDAKKRGKTFIISTHGLDEIEYIMDNAVFFYNGKVLEETNVKTIKEVCSAISIVTKSVFDIASLERFGKYIDIQDNNHIILKAEHEDKLNYILKELISLNVRISSVMPQSASLQEYFVKLMKGAEKK